MIAGVCLVRDAVDIIGPVVEHMLTELDHVIVADNLSVDGTSEVLAELADRNPRLTVELDDDPRHLQSAKTTRLAAVAAELGARWIVPFDSDEVWYSPFGRLADVLEEIPSGWSVASAVLYDHVTTDLDDRTELDPTRRIRYRRTTPGPFPKVAVRYADDLTIEDGNHGAHYGPAYWGQPPPITGRLIVRHFPYRSAEQMHRKAVTGSAALRAAELHPDIGKHWHDYAALGPDLLRDVYLEHFHAPDPTARRDLVFDPVPRRR